MSAVLKVALPGLSDPLLQRLPRILTRVLATRGWPALALVSEASGADLAFHLAPELGPEAYRVSAGPAGQIQIASGGSRGLLYGLGKVLRHSVGPGGVYQPCTWRGQAEPRRGMRGIYFATHFHNYYQEAPIAEIEAYLEDLALWGFNALTVWYDMHHFQGLADPAAQAMLARLRDLMLAARAVGLSPGLIFLANEGYASTPKHLRARATKRAHYGVEVCVASAEGQELVLANLRGELAAFAEVGVDRLVLWPYDQGGCGCPECAPWGHRGMLKIGEAVAKTFRAQFPAGQVVYSTWLFDYGADQGEWRGLAEAFKTKPDWVDYLMADSHTAFPRHPLTAGVPGGLPLLNFPEISMYGMGPWGGFGANPLLHRFGRLWQECAHLADGGFPYSEGIFEDLNKLAYAQFYWTGESDSRPVIAEYAAYELGGASPATVGRLLDMLEQNHGCHWLWPTAVRAWGGPANAQPVTGYPGWKRLPPPASASLERADCAMALVRELEATMPAWASQGWRWRLLRLRATLDRELLGNGGDATPGCLAAFTELTQLYHAAQAEDSVAPPLPTRV